MLRTRTSERVRSRATGLCRTDRGQDFDLQLDDLSQGGCRLDDPKGLMRLGALVSLSIAGTGPHVAEVAWRQSDRVGLEFRRPLPERVYHLLSREQWDAARSAFDEGGYRTVVRRLI